MSAATVLIVDDDPGVRRALERALRLEGFVVRTAAGGDEALRETGVRPPRALVLDMSMPGTDGLTVIRRLRGRGGRHADLRPLRPRRPGRPHRDPAHRPRRQRGVGPCRRPIR